MFTKFTASAVAASILVTVGSAAIAAPKQASHHQTLIQQQVLAGSHLSLNSVPSAALVGSTDRANQSSNISQREFEGLAHLIEALDDFAN